MVITGENVKSKGLEELSKFIFASKYARYNEELKRRETWEEAVDRVLNMHLKKYYNLLKEDKDKIKWAFSLVKEKRVLPSMRSLQFGGIAIEAKNERIYNCSVRHVDSLRSFAEIFFLLLCGCGVGIGLNSHFLSRLPNLVSPDDKNGTILTYVIQDTIEGWADSIEALLQCYFKNTAFTGRKIVFDYSKIRRKGEPLKTGGGKAPGYKGLKFAHQKIKELLDHIIEWKGQTRLYSIDAYDILMYCADAVLSGGVRRSATCVIFDKNDKLMIESKTYKQVDKVYSFDEIGEETIGGNTYKLYQGKILYEGQKLDVVVKEWELTKLKDDKLITWKYLYPQRARSNNSVLFIRNQFTIEEFTDIISKTKQFGDPGFVFGDHPHQLYNPCFEISFIPVLKDGTTGCQFCNLTTINGRLVDTFEKFKECVEAEAIMGTLQVGYTNFPYLSNASKILTEEEALLGCSITGFMDNPNILLNENFQKEMAEFAVSVNKIWAEKLGIKPAARITAVKPEGTTSCLLGTGSGIHPHHARKYIRRVQNNKIDNVYKFFKKNNPEVCEESLWSVNGTDEIINFPIEVSENSIIKEDLSAIEHLEIIKKTQENWVLTGSKLDSNKKGITNNVSCTITVKPSEWEEVIEYLYKNQEFFGAVALIASSGDKDYVQPPMESMKTEGDLKIWKDLKENLRPVDYQNLIEMDDKTSLVKEISCGGGKCEII